MSELLAQADSAPLTMLAGDARPELHLSGAKLRQALETAIAGCEPLGGVERYIDALKLKSRLFVTTLIDSPIEALERDALIALCAFMPTVRRRIGHHTDHDGLARLRHALELAGTHRGQVVVGGNKDGLNLGGETAVEHRQLRFGFSIGGTAHAPYQGGSADGASGLHNVALVVVHPHR